MPQQEPFLKENLKLRFEKCLAKQIKPIKFTPFTWVETPEVLETTVKELEGHLSQCNLLSVDLEYHTFGRVSLTMYNLSLAH